MDTLMQQILPVDARQEELTRRFLLPALGEIERSLYALRADIDAELAPRLPPIMGGGYPRGRCLEITMAALARLQRRLRAPGDAGELALHNFVLHGGSVRLVWGVLRERYFQNAFQAGGLYLDVSNDTVVPTKPKVEILPIAESGLENVRDLDHFRTTAEGYWGAAVYANTLVPSLAPLLPLITVSPGLLEPGLQSACNYMIGLMCRDGFRQAEAWVANAPAPPPDVAAAILAAVPPDLLPRTADGRAEGIAACRHARACGNHQDAGWRDMRVRDYLRIAARMPVVAP
ncbi:hypothetical protein M2352_003031 [Azospirillum fermentarium]|uniref:hypothetical protein n=1 Tax=Azospirillum fermentarium TaxID=1233114 RepID=UPI0022277D89|nr:hypothetical protein [Azospirillum fermentarium]MCW2247397.1 hypothetical protein [Azospirillum fermentarium]